MKKVQFTLDEELIEAVDQFSRQLGTTRSDFVRQALRDAVERHRVALLEEKHRRGYERHPVLPGEFPPPGPGPVWFDE